MTAAWVDLELQDADQVARIVREGAFGTEELRLAFPDVVCAERIDQTVRIEVTRVKQLQALG
jgi:hypothetical protein